MREVPLLTAVECDEFIGKVGQMRVGNMSVSVEIIDCKNRPGGRNFRVSPDSGIGTTWATGGELSHFATKSVVATVAARHGIRL